MADGAARLDVHLHPLVLINMSDHVVRARSYASKERVLGALIGAQEGRRIDLHNSFEILIQEEEGARTLDLEFFNLRLAQYLEVFPRYEFLGWYSTGKAPHDGDKALHKKLQEVTGNENPFALLLDTEAMDQDKANQSEELPVKVYDSVTTMSSGESVTQWTEAPYVIDTLEAERISVNHVAKSAKTTEGHSSDFTQHTSGLSNSVAMLTKRLKELLEYMQDVKAGRVAKNHEVLRQMMSICQALKASHPEALQTQFMDEFNDANLVVLLSSLTKTCAHTSDLLDKFQLAHDKKHRQRHHYPFG